MYDGDSFFTLEPMARAGLVGLSLLLMTGGLVGVWVLGQGRRLWLRLMLAVVVFFLFVWLSPQIYYEYYLLIIDGLPRQSVIGAPPGILQYIELATFSGRGRLSDHAQGFLFWSLIGVAMWPSARAPDDRPE